MSAECFWCKRTRIYDDGTKCAHGSPPIECRVHGRQTDLNLVARGRRAVIKCVHYGEGWVVLYADPIGDDKEHGTYTIVFAWPGLGFEQYKIPPQRGTCPHYVFDQLVGHMRAGARPSPNRVPDPSTRVGEPGKELPDA